MVPSELKFTSEHEWIKIDGNAITVGISDHAQNALGDIVFVDLPDEGAEFDKGEEAIALESAKAAASVYAPAAGSITAVNEELADDPALVNNEPYEGGWIFKMEVADASPLDGLMDAAAYEEYLKTLD